MLCIYDEDIDDDDDDDVIVNILLYSMLFHTSRFLLLLLLCTNLFDSSYIHNAHEISIEFFFLKIFFPVFIIIHFILDFQVEKNLLDCHTPFIWSKQPPSEQCIRLNEKTTEKVLFQSNIRKKEKIKIKSSTNIEKL